MTTTEFIPVETAVERYGISKEKILNKVLQQTIRMENCDGYVGISVDDLDAEYVNTKITAGNTAPAPTNKSSTRWTRAEDKYLREHYLTETKDEMARALGRTPNGVEHRICYLRSKKRLTGPEYITGPQAAAMLGRSQTYPYSLAATGKLHPVTVPGGAKKFFLKSEVAAIAETRGRAEIEPPTPVVWVPLNEAASLTGRGNTTIRKMITDEKIRAEKRPYPGVPGYRWVIHPDDVARIKSRKRAASAPAHVAPERPAPAFVRNRIAAESKDRAAVQAELEAEVAEVAEPEPKPEATVETAPAARGGLLARVKAVCETLKRRRA